MDEPNETQTDDAAGQPDWLIVPWDALASSQSRAFAGMSDKSRERFSPSDFRPAQLIDHAVGQAQLLIAGSSLDPEIRPTTSQSDHRDLFQVVSLGYHLGWWALDHHPDRALSRGLDSQAQTELARRLAHNTLDTTLGEIATKLIIGTDQIEAISFLKLHARDSAIGQRLGRERAMPTMSVAFTAGFILAMLEHAALNSTLLPETATLPQDDRDDPEDVPVDDEESDAEYTETWEEEGPFPYQIDMPQQWTFACGCDRIGTIHILRGYKEPYLTAECEEHGRQLVTACHDLDGNPLEFDSGR